MNFILETALSRADIGMVCHILHSMAFKLDIEDQRVLPSHLTDTGEITGKTIVVEIKTGTSQLRVQYFYYCIVRPTNCF